GGKSAPRACDQHGPYRRVGGVLQDCVAQLVPELGVPGVEAFGAVERYLGDRVLDQQINCFVGSRGSFGVHGYLRLVVLLTEPANWRSPQNILVGFADNLKSREPANWRSLQNMLVGLADNLKSREPANWRSLNISDDTILLPCRLTSSYRGWNGSDTPAFGSGPVARRSTSTRTGR